MNAEFAHVILSQEYRYLLAEGYAVLFLHRRGSLEPYKRHFQHINFLDMLQPGSPSPTGKAAADKGRNQKLIQLHVFTFYLLKFADLFISANPQYATS